MENKEVIIIRDITSIILTGIAFLICLFLLYVCLTDFRYTDKMVFTGIIIATLVIYFRIRVIYEGIKIDILNDTLSYPGGGISFNNFEETLSNLNQFFKRYSHRLSTIQYIKATDKRFMDKKGNIHYTYILTFTSSSNTVDLKFSTSSKRDQVYSLIANINNMGIPINRR